MSNQPLPFKRKISKTEFQNAKKSKFQNAKKSNKGKSKNAEIKWPKKFQKTAKSSIIEGFEDDTTNYGECLNRQTLLEGMIVLGCVIELKPKSFIMALPGCLTGVVSLENISDAFTRRLNGFDDDLPPLDLHMIIKLGMTFPCKVMKIVPCFSSQWLSISLSINPKDVNENLRPQSLYPNMVLFAAVSSQEDIGYIMDVGGKGVTAFLRYSTENMTSGPLEVGQVIPTCSRSIVSYEGTSSVQLIELNINKAFPLIEDETLRLTSILPGANVTAYVTEVKHPFAFMKCLNFKACAFLMSAGSSYNNIIDATKVCGTVLYVHPLTHQIYLHLGAKPTPKTFSTYFGIKKYDLLQNVKFQCLYRNKAYFRVPRGCLCFVNKSEFQANEFSTKKLTAKETSFPRARVMNLHFVDNVVQLTFKKSLVEVQVKNRDDFKIGDMCEGIVKKHVEDGIIISLCPGVNGFVGKLHITDVCLNQVKPEALYPLNTKVTCRVLCSASGYSVQLTLKKSLLALLEHDILKFYDDAVCGHFYKGVIVDIKENYMIILFFNDVRGLVSSEFIPEGAVYFIGQTIQCEVLNSNPQQKKMKLSLKSTRNLNSLKEISQDVSLFSSFQEEMLIESDDCEIMDESTIKLKSNDYTKDDSFQAKITRIMGHQLVIALGENLRGRVHISEIGCSKENVYPLREFSVGQDIQVHIISHFKQKSVKYLDISHRRMVSMMECALKIPEPVSLTLDFCPGMHVMAYIREVHDTEIICWISPKKIGILDYLHFSDNPKILRKLRKKLDIGLAVNATVFHVNKSFKKEGLRCSIVLTKLGNILPTAGSNVVGLTQSFCLVNGLTLKLPHGYRGQVALCDLQDIYGPLDFVFEKYKKTKFTLCYVLEVNHETKFCNLSLRASRLYKQKKADTEQFCPEIGASDMKKGLTVKGYVTKFCGNYILIHISRQLAGRINLHFCSTLDCLSCRRSKLIKLKYPVGSVVSTNVNGVLSQDNNLYDLSFVNLDPSLQSKSVLQT